MIKTFKTTILYLLFLLIVALPAAALAQDSNKSLVGRLRVVGDYAGYNTDQSVASTPQIVGIIIGAFLAFLGIVFIILTVVAGFSWMTAGGNEEKVKKATTTIKNALIGLIVSLSAWSLWNFIFKRLIGL